jgi:choline dehydrogenase
VTSSALTGTYDYIVVGSGAGGGPLAANLAEAGFSTLLLEAGSDHQDLTYEVPAFHGLASENPDLCWNYFVRHYTDDQQQEQDSKFVAGAGGVLYPRAGTLGGCSAHNAMITVYPCNHDWDYIAALMGDETWGSAKMRSYFERLERCHYERRGWRYPNTAWLASLIRHTPLLRSLYGNPSRHGYRGWLPTSLPNPTLALRDQQIVDIILDAARQALADHLGRPLTHLEDIDEYFDPNDWRAVAGDPQGLWFTPLATQAGRRHGTRERIRSVAANSRHLRVETEALATSVRFERNRAVGVRYLRAARLYRADPRVTAASNGGQECEALARREVILAAGAFNSPQLLMLSGVGPRHELESFGIPVLVDRPGVGQNLQDRYEVGIVSELSHDLSLLRDCTFAPPLPGSTEDSGFTEWKSGKGVYTTNGVVVSIVLRSSPEHTEPDLFVFGLPARFRGYYPGYSHDLERGRDFFTWAILKAHTNNTAGTVRLRSTDARDMPLIDFHYFEESNDVKGDDLSAVVAGIEFVRRITKHEVFKRELVPGSQVATQEQLAEFVRSEAWGHHASCSCKMGPSSDPMAVVDNEFRVYGTECLRVVDASVFPRIPGFFIVTAVYMLSEKASDAIVAAAQRPMANGETG